MRMTLVIIAVLGCHYFLSVLPVSPPFGHDEILLLCGRVTRAKVACPGPYSAVQWVRLKPTTSRSPVQCSPLNYWATLWMWVNLYLAQHNDGLNATFCLLSTSLVILLCLLAIWASLMSSVTTVGFNAQPITIKCVWRKSAEVCVWWVAWSSLFITPSPC